MHHETMGHTELIIPLHLFTAAITALLAVLGWRFRSRPGALPFAGMMVAMTLMNTLLPLRQWAVHSSPLASFVLVRIWDTASDAMVLLWLLFVLGYGGYSRLRNRYVVAALATPTVVLATTSWIDRSVYDPGAGHPMRTVLLVYFFGYMVVGILLLLRFVVSERRLYTGQAVALAVGMGVPVVALFLEIPGGAAMLGWFAVTGLAFAFAVFRSDVFTYLPVTRRIGRDNAIEDLGEGVFIVDPDGTVVDANRSGAAIFGREPDDLLGEPLAAALGDQRPADADDRVAPATYETDDGRIYGVTVSSIHDRADRPVGHTVVFRDITDRELRETQLEVLNRVLRHNLRNELSVVQGHANVLADHAPAEAADSVDSILDATTELMETGDRARAFEELDTRDESAVRPVEASSLVEWQVESLRADHPDADVSLAVPEALELETYPAVLELVLDNLLRNAAEHGGQRPHVEVVASATDGEVAFEVRDDGPGIPESEVAVIRSGSESALDHGSGLGLWIVTWGVRYLGGDLAFEENEPRGTVARVTVPRTVPGSGGKGDLGSTTGG